MYTIAIIGAGQLGSRHLQAMKKVKVPLSIFVIDPDQNSLDTAKERYSTFGEGLHQHSLRYSQNYDNIPKRLDLVIVASSSNPRKKIIEDILECTNIKYLVLEKILFSKVEHLNQIEKLIEQKSIKTWVNCSMRMTPIWKEIKSYVARGPIRFKVTGVNYGLVTNIIHYLDYMSYLTDCNDFKLNLESVYKNIYESKRPGYKELMGTIIAKYKDGSVGLFECIPGSDISINVEIASGCSNVKLNLVSEAGERKNSLSHNFSAFDFHIPYQSELTTEFVNSLIETGECELPKYSVSAKTHKLMMAPIIKFLNENTDYKEKNFPFT